MAHPLDNFLRMDRMPHIWCSGCGIGTAVNCFVRAITKTNIDPDQIFIVSGIGCTGRVAGYLNLDSFHTTHGRAIPFATGMKLANPSLKVVVFSGDGDLIAIGGNHFIHAARRNIDIIVICVNNFNYAMTGGQMAPTTHKTAVATTSPYGNFETPFNLPHLADSCGAVYVARWTTFHFAQLIRSIKEAFSKKGFSFIEVIAPCPTIYDRRNRLGDGLKRMKFFKEKSVRKHDADTRELDLSLKEEIIVGKFVDRERPEFLDSMNEQLKSSLGERYQEYPSD